ncbi:hypothetical protein L1D29_10960 [Shewanella insulae]|uniref:hypothetical protein n=1 Tax=Shewanella insulae TaxID=2681496 RepID=UPI001EFEC08F|nr:hypothetical protein [Shewanella insulae]MCG9713330.1 hypothetical protein [Shewanella insulae]
MNKSEFIATTAARILSSMYANSDIYPNHLAAIAAAEELWDSLVQRAIIVEEKI